MKELTDILHASGASCVVKKDGHTSTYNSRGVLDLYQLYTEGRLCDAEVADKVIGKGAATLMIAGGVGRVYGDVVSRPAFELFVDYGIDITYGKLTDHIINRTGTGPCPLESRCTASNDIKTLIPIIENFVAQIKCSQKQ